MEKKNQEQVNFIWKPLCIIFAAFLTLSWVFFGFLYSKGGVDFSSLQNSVMNTDATVTDGDGNVLDSGKIHALPKALVFSGELSDDAYRTIRVEAIVKPDYAIDKRVDWSISFYGNNEWSTGKKVTDFVTITPLEDGSRFADITCHAAFAEHIEIEVRSRANPSAVAECYVYFKQKYLGTKFHFENKFNNGETSVEWLDAKKVSADKPVLTNKIKAFYEDLSNEFTFRAEQLFSSVYTHPMEIRNLVTFKIKMTEEFLLFLRDNGYNPPDSVINYSDIEINTSLPYPQTVSMNFLDGLWFESVSGSSNGSAMHELAVRINEFSGTAYQFLLFREGNLNKPSSTFDVVIDLSLILAPTNVTVDPPEVVL